MHRQGRIQKEWLGANGGAEVERRRREDRGAEGAEEVGCGEGVSPSPLGKGSVPLPGKCFDFRALKGEFWCILGLIKPTFDWPGVSIFLTIIPLRGGGSIAPSPLPWIRPCAQALYRLHATIVSYMDIEKTFHSFSEFSSVLAYFQASPRKCTENDKRSH